MCRHPGRYNLHMMSITRWFSLLVGISFLASACSPAAPAASQAAPSLAVPSATTAPQAAPTSPPASLVPAANTTPTPVAPTAPVAPTVPPTSAGPFPADPGSLRQIVSGLDRPVYLTQPADGTNRLFIVEQPGLIAILQDGRLLPDPFLDLRDRVNSRGDEQGLLGLAFHPQYRQNGRFFVDYTDAKGAANIVRYTVSASDPNRADPASATAILRIDHPNYQNHNGGDLVFGPDGYLYFGMGDGGSQGDPLGHGQSLTTLLAKLLRIDVNVEPYGIPPDNPFRGHALALPEIWAYGLRNPWRFSFDRATGDLYIADVGQDTYEEVDFQPAGSRGGQNYGWNYMEGFHPYEGTAPPGLTDPIAEYSHAEGGCAIIGGYVYRGTQVPQLRGLYVFGDNCSGLIWGLARTSAGWQKTVLFRSGLAISSFGEDQAGEVYVLDLRGAVYQWVAAGQ
jgi:glucose/arabinose dehydrogenase